MNRGTFVLSLVAFALPIVMVLGFQFSGLESEFVKEQAKAPISQPSAQSAGTFYYFYAPS